MKTIGVVACCDTKRAEIDFVADLIEAAGQRALIIDISTSAGFLSPGDISREEVVAAAGLAWPDLEGGPKDVLLESMAEGAAATLSRLYQDGRIDGTLGLGGLQNTTIAARAMRSLPLGVPKLIVSTVACGTRTFDMIVGTKDITVMPSITDLAGLNVISEAVLSNAAAAVVGMVQYAGHTARRTDGVIVGTTLMGATNDGVVAAAEQLEAAGQQVMCFHSTGVGGQVMEDLIADGTIGAAMDLTLHEVVYEYFGGGFGAGTTDRLASGARAGIPMVVTPGGIDFICQWRHELFDDIDERKMIWHNAQLAHVKLTVAEVREISRMIVSRLNKAAGPVVVLFPTLGLRTFAKAGEPLHDAEVDAAILREFREGLREDIPLRLIEASIIDPEFSRAAAEAMAELLPRGTSSGTAEPAEVAS